MARALLAAVLAGGLVVIPGSLTARPGDDGAKKAPADPAAVLRDKVAAYAGDLRTTPLVDVLRDLAKAHDVTFIIDNGAFDQPAAVAAAKAGRLTAAGLDKLPLGRFLDAYLGALEVPEGVAYLARPGHVEITSADKAGKTPVAPGAAKLINTLHNQPVSYGGDLQTAPLQDVLRDLAKTYDVTFVVDTTAFDQPAAVAEAKASGLTASRLEGLTLGQFLNVYLRALPSGGDPDGADRVTYLIREWGIEITTVNKARVEAGLTEAIQLADESEDQGAGARARARLNLPLVSLAAENIPVTEAVQQLARVYGLNVVFDKQARQAAAQAPVSARLLNVPADTALELLAGEASLDVSRKGNTFRITLGGGGQ